MKTILILLILLFVQFAHGQYHYNDISGAKLMEERMKNYVANKVKSVTGTGYDKQGVKTSDFNEWQELSPGNDQLKVTTRTGQQVTRQYYQFDKEYRLISLTDSSGDIKSTSAYGYDNSKNIISIKTTTQDNLRDFNETEEHQWIYNAQGKPTQMWRIVNGKDSTEYRLTVDEKGNVSDEQLYRRGVGIEPVYYYYNDENQLTDIVRYNKRAKRLLPDFMFEYDENGRMIQKITTLSTLNRDYLIWRYIFNEKGLKMKEALFNKDKELTGRIEYQYTFY